MSSRLSRALKAQISTEGRSCIMVFLKDYCISAWLHVILVDQYVQSAEWETNEPLPTSMHGIVGSLCLNKKKRNKKTTFVISVKKVKRLKSNSAIFSVKLVQNFRVLLAYSSSSAPRLPWCVWKLNSAKRFGQRMCAGGNTAGCRRLWVQYRKHQHILRRKNVLAC